MCIWGFGWQPILYRHFCTNQNRTGIKVYIRTFSDLLFCSNYNHKCREMHVVLTKSWDMKIPSFQTYLWVRAYASEQLMNLTASSYGKNKAYDLPCLLLTGTALCLFHQTLLHIPRTMFCPLLWPARPDRRALFRSIKKTEFYREQ